MLTYRVGTRLRRPKTFAVTWVGAAGSLESRVAEGEGIAFRAVATGKVRRAGMSWPEKHARNADPAAIGSRIGGLRTACRTPSSCSRPRCPALSARERASTEAPCAGFHKALPQKRHLAAPAAASIGTLPGLPVLHGRVKRGDGCGDRADRRILA